MILTKTMHAAVLTGPGRFEIQTRPVPEPGPREVRVRLEGCGICSSNLSAWEGRPWLRYPFEAGSPGHEGWGLVDSVGSEVESVIPGERVALLSYHAFVEYDLAPEYAVASLPAALNGGPCPGDPLGRAMNVFGRSRVQPEETVAIIGIGFLGALLTNLAALTGARVIAISRRPYALELARDIGATETIAMEDHRRIVEQVQEMTSGNLCDTVIEATGHQEPLDLAGELARIRGKLVVAGFHQDGPRQVNMQLWNWKGLDVINAHERDPTVYLNGVREALKAMALGRLTPEPLFTHSYRLEALPNAFETMRSRPYNFLKACVSFD